MPDTRQVRIIAVSAPVVNSRDVALSLRTDCGDGVVCVLSRSLALGLAEAIGAALLPPEGGAARPLKTGLKRHGTRGLPPERVAAILAHFPAYRRGETTLDAVAAATGVSHTSVSRYFSIFAREAAEARGPVLKPGGALL